MILPHWVEMLRLKSNTADPESKLGPSPTPSPAATLTQRNEFMSDETEQATNTNAATTEAPAPNVTVTTASASTGTDAVKPTQVLFTVEQLAELFAVATQLVTLLSKVKSDAADSWPDVAADFKEAADAFNAATARGQVVPEQPAAITYGGADDLSLGSHQEAVTPHAEPPVTVAGTQG